MQRDIPAQFAPDFEFAALLPVGAVPIGIGTSRDAFELPHHPALIAKVAKQSPFANWVEFVVFHQLVSNEMFGRVFSISETGKYLIMERLDNVPLTQSLPEVPECWTDRKRDNLGVARDKNVKIRDYALTKVLLGVSLPMPSSEAVADMARLIALAPPIGGA